MGDRKVWNADLVNALRCRMYAKLDAGKPSFAFQRAAELIESQGKDIYRKLFLLELFKMIDISLLLLPSQMRHRNSSNSKSPEKIVVKYASTC